MTEIIRNLHMIGAHEIGEISNVDLVIDMGGIFHKIVYPIYTSRGITHLFTADFPYPILSCEIDEVPDSVFANYQSRMGYVSDCALIGANMVSSGKSVYTLCLAGQNRSGLMAGLIMVGMGFDCNDAVRIIQSRRENTLNNNQIKEYLSNVFYAVESGIPDNSLLGDPPKSSDEVTPSSA